MVLNKNEKKDLVNWLTKVLKESKGIAFVQMQGITANGVNDLRSKLHENNINCKVVKNTLLKKAAESMNMKFDESLFGKTIALAISDKDEVEPNKIVYEFSKSNNAVKLVGSVVNETYYDEVKAVALAKLPGRDELYAKVVGSLAAPLSGMVNVLAGNLRGLVSVLDQYQKSKK